MEGHLTLREGKFLDSDENEGLVKEKLRIWPTGDNQRTKFCGPEPKKILTHTTLVLPPVSAICANRMSTPKILAFAGSARTGSFNKKLIKIGAQAARDAGAEVTLVDLRDLPMPLFDQDLEDASGLPENAKKWKTLMRQHHGFLISAPEYNSSITPLLKNAIDWASRSESEDEPDLVAFRGKTAALLSASPSGFGGMRGLVHVRSILGNIGVIVVPDQVSISAAYDAFTDAGGLKDERKTKQVANVAKSLVEATRKLMPELR